ncbi:hypothetical protein RSOLAG1IB_07223 [Rhizoctonia solani AG-1 IB]|uniref:Uncharacterized protein n=1 Tax=Thanatephorus cucumeris (strain AG1-IB / isolate 7/3/14) TaxID=1108050 RepID=A0A0B7FCR3_THACB|nr:hypothetical protein RSOLAG1IB_07223 [Rhizoctonia solani AG-1 IB]
MTEQQELVTFPLLVSSSSGIVRIEQVSWDNPVGQMLRDEQVAEISARFGTPPENAPGIPPSAENIALFLLAYPENTDEPVACGAIRHLDDGFMEASFPHPP